MMAQIELFPVSVYFVWQWWEKHYQRFFTRPSNMDFDWLEQTYVGRQKFLYEHFTGIEECGSEPVLNYNLLSQVMPFHTMIIPVILGMEVKIQDVGGYTWQNMSVEKLKNLKPINIAESSISEVILTQSKQRKARYGISTQMIDLASVSNNAFMMRGPDFYSDLIIDKAFAENYLGVITETMCMAYKFITDIFGPIEGFPLGNCNVTMMSPQLYDEVISEYDIECVNYAAKLSGEKPLCDLHHCNVNTEPFAKSYSRIPGLRKLQGSYHSNISTIFKSLPEVKFSAMVNPVELLNRPIQEILDDIERIISLGANDLAIWDIDPESSPERLNSFFCEIREIAERYNKKASFDIIPFSWEELAWEFPVYVNRKDLL
jgi:hypothetical protein